MQVICALIGNRDKFSIYGTITFISKSCKNGMNVCMKMGGWIKIKDNCANQKVYDICIIYCDCYLLSIVSLESDCFSEMIYVYLMDGLKFVAKLIKHCSFFLEREASPTVSSMYRSYNIGVACSS